MATVNFKGTTVQLSGTFPSKGEVAKDAEFVNTDLECKRISDFTAKYTVLNIFPSVDTGICAQSVREFNKRASQLEDTVVLCISKDLPFAQGRFCGSEGLDKVVMLSTFRNHDFAKDYGVELAESPLAGLTTRAVVILDSDRNVLYSELVPEIGQEPNYDAALAVLN